MYFTYGFYRHPLGECLVTNFTQTKLYNRRGRAHIIRRSMTVEGEIIAADTTAIDTRVREMVQAYSIPAAAAYMSTSTGASTGFVLSNTFSLTGVRVIEGPSFHQREHAAHYVTGLPFTIRLECDYLGNTSLMEYEETITKVGDGRGRRIVLEVDSGPPVVQFTTTHTPITVMQEGKAVGVAQYPTPNLPLFNDAIDGPDGIQINEGTPELYGNAYIGYPISWKYRMVFPQNPSLPHPTLREG